MAPTTGAPSVTLGRNIPVHFVAGDAYLTGIAITALITHLAHVMESTQDPRVSASVDHITVECLTFPEWDNEGFQVEVLVANITFITAHEAHTTLAAEYYPELQRWLS